MVRFIHSADWQLGMRRHFLDADAQARFSDARVEAIRTIGRLAVEQRCAFVVVAGDVFESNHVDRRTVRRALEALGASPVPFYLLPGNHDPLDAASVFRSPVFREACPANVHVLDTALPVTVAPGVEVVGAPWPNKHPLRDLVAEACDGLRTAQGVVRVCVGHGAVDRGIFEHRDPAAIRLSDAERGLADGRIHYLALGDRHSVTTVGDTGRIWYAGAPEATDYDEERPGHALVVELAAGECRVEAHPVGTWRFVAEEAELNCEADVEVLADRLARLPDRSRTVVRLAASGVLGLRAHARLDRVVEEASEVLGALEWRPRADLVALPDDADLADLPVVGFAREAVGILAELAAGQAAEAVIARDALVLLHRLVA